MDKEILNSKAISIIAKHNKCFKAAIAFESKGRKVMVAAFELLIPDVETFSVDTGVPIGKAWEKYFQPELERLYGKRGFSFSTFKVYRGLKENPEKKESYLSGAINLSPERQKIDKDVVDSVTGLKTLIAKVNTLIDKVKDRAKVEFEGNVLVVKDVIQATQTI